MEEVARPGPPRGLSEALGGLVEKWHEAVSWFGLGRLVASASAVLIVCFGVFWLVRSPPPPLEASLPLATMTSAGPIVATLAPPVTSAPIVSPPDGPLTVHVAGAVNAPGVYVLRTGDRVGQAIGAAGGATADGRPDELNLAALLVDGSRIHVPVDGEEVVPPATVPGIAADDQAVVSGPIDVNRASTAELETLPGVGPATAAAIVVERERNGPFLNVDDLERVSGVGPGKVELLRDLVTV